MLPFTVKLPTGVPIMGPSIDHPLEKGYSMEKGWRNGEARALEPIVFDLSSCLRLSQDAYKHYYFAYACSGMKKCKILEDTDLLSAYSVADSVTFL